MTIAITTPIIGVATDRTTSTQEFPLGTEVSGAGNNSYTYAQATLGAIAAAGTVNLTAGFGTSAGSTYTHDVAAPGVAANGYFWAKKATTPF